MVERGPKIRWRDLYFGKGRSNKRNNLDVEANGSDDDSSVPDVNKVNDNFANVKLARAAYKLNRDSMIVASILTIILLALPPYCPDLLCPLV